MRLLLSLHRYGLNQSPPPPLCLSLWRPDGVKICGLLQGNIGRCSTISAPGVVRIQKPAEQNLPSKGLAWQNNNLLFGIQSVSLSIYILIRKLFSLPISCFNSFTFSINWSCFLRLISVLPSFGSSVRKAGPCSPNQRRGWARVTVLIMRWALRSQLSARACGLDRAHRRIDAPKFFCLFYWIALVLSLGGVWKSISEYLRSFNGD